MGPATIRPGDPRKRISDGEEGALSAVVRLGSAHGRRFDYSRGGRRKPLSPGTHPDTTLKAAHRKADEFRKLVVAEGTDPSGLRKTTKQAQRAALDAESRDDRGLPPVNSFEAVAREWVATVHQDKVSAGHAARTLIRFEQDVFPWLGRLPIIGIEAPALLDLLRRLEARGAIETRHRIKHACGQVFRYGIASGVCQRNPAADLRDALKPVIVKHMTSVTDPQQVGKLLRLTENYTGFPTTRAALQLAPMLFQRPGKLRAMTWAEVDLEAAARTIPAAQMKRSVNDKLNGQPHVVPLARQAVAMLRDLQPLTGSGQHVFPSVRGSDRPMSSMTLIGALQRMGIDTQLDMTTHGLRAMARTMRAERLEVPAQVIEAQLAGGASTWPWSDSSTGEQIASIGISTGHGLVWLRDEHNGKPICDEVRVVRTVCNYGGGRPWFACRRCTDRVAGQYLRAVPACRPVEGHVGLQGTARRCAGTLPEPNGLRCRAGPESGKGECPNARPARLLQRAHAC